MLADIPTYPVLDFPWQILQSNEKESEIYNATAILKVSGKQNLLMNLNRVSLIVLSFFNFYFSIDFIGGQ